MSRRPDPRLVRTRSKVTHAAYLLLLERGFGRLRMDDVSARSGVSKSTLYRHWPTRDDLLLEAFETHASGGAVLEVGSDGGLLGRARAVAIGLELSWGRAVASLAAEALQDRSSARVLEAFMQAVRRETGEVVRILAQTAGRSDMDAVVERLLASMFHRYLFTDEGLDADFVTAEVEHSLAELR